MYQYEKSGQTVFVRIQYYEYEKRITNTELITKKRAGIKPPFFYLEGNKKCSRLCLCVAPVCRANGTGRRRQVIYQTMPDESRSFIRGVDESGNYTWNFMPYRMITNERETLSMGVSKITKYVPFASSLVLISNVYTPDAR